MVAAVMRVATAAAAAAAVGTECYLLEAIHAGGEHDIASSTQGLAIHVVLDNLSAHKAPKTTKGLGNRPARRSSAVNNARTGPHGSHSIADRVPVHMLRIAPSTFEHPGRARPSSRHRRQHVPGRIPSVRQAPMTAWSSSVGATVASTPSWARRYFAIPSPSSACS
jgi:hypothetical protein